jgi:hypothetical protein
MNAFPMSPQRISNPLWCAIKLSNRMLLLHQLGADTPQFNHMSTSYQPGFVSPILINFKDHGEFCKLVFQAALEDRCTEIKASMP